MSTVGHLFVGAAASRYALPHTSGLRRLVFAALLVGITVAPDLDLALLPALGVPESLTLGHRGATHSLVAALAVVVIVTLLAIAVRLPARRLAIGALLAIGSHAILDSLTPGPGVAWLWPFTIIRFPTLPILPMAPLSHLFNTHGLVLLLAEVIVFSPFLAYAVLARQNDAHHDGQRPRSP
ncbi:MAG: metal-dependent hydrolase [Candidatus Limnocylindria bacterium]